MASGERRVPPGHARGLIAWVLVQAALTTAAAGPDSDAPDIDLLAYLGSWTGSDEEWVAVAEWDGKPDEKAPEEPEPNEEKDDE